VGLDAHAAVLRYLRDAEEQWLLQRPHEPPDKTP
jgi:hypothetical protein